jgi:hypothetical protein
MAEELHEDLQNLVDELDEDLKLDEMNLRETQIKLPSIKHKWVARLINQKIEKNKLKRLRKDAVRKIIENADDISKVQLSKPSILKHAEQHSIIKKIDDEIEMCELLIMHLEKVVDICRSATYDVKNIIEIIKLENT